MPDYIISNANPDVVELPKAFDGPPEQLHPGQIDYASFNDNPALKRASDAFNFGFEEGGAINELRANPHDEDRAATHDRKVRERIEDRQGLFVEKLTGAMNEVKAEYARVDASLEAKAGLKADPAQFNAIIGTLQMTPVAQRPAKVSALIERGSNAILATIIEADPFLTELPPEFLATIKTRVFMKVDPVGLKLRDELAATLAKIDVAGMASIKMFDALRAGTGPGAWKERAKQTAIRNASNNFRRG